ncbi:MAG: BlaI/MecI/CopY family transcriptional regulator [Candidatus Atribacteria bacterium]|nr:BlaI/MecI/CopY family transcriptional regulator [Candidatus Atribacteria bacterium]
MSTGPHAGLSRRERQIVEIIYRKKRGSVKDIRGEMPDPPSYSVVRTTVNILERKGYLTHTANGNRYIYAPKTSRQKATRGALKHLLGTYFDNSLEKAVTAMIELRAGDLTEADLKRLSELIRKGR